MPAKYQCKQCLRSFVHKETLKEHKLLHGSVILGGNKFTCPICQHEVTCESGVHHHGKNYSVTRSRTAELHQTKADNHVSSREATLENGVNAHGRPKEGIKLRLKNKNVKWKEKPETDFTDPPGSVSCKDPPGSVSCKICGRSFVYQKCLQKHTALVHGLTSEDRSKADVKSDGLVSEEVVLPQEAEDDEDHAASPLSVINDNGDHVPDGWHAVDASGDGAKSILEYAKESFESRAETISGGHSGKSAEWKVSASDLTCKTCLKQFKHKAMLLRHMHMIHGETDFERCTCPMCSQKFSSQWTFSKHFDVEHKTKAAEMLASVVDGQINSCTSDGNDGDVDVVRCEKCVQWFTCRRSFQKHCSLKHRSDMKSHIAHLKSAASSRTTDANRDTGSCKDRKTYANRTTHENSKPLASSNSQAEILHSGSSSDGTVQDVSDDFSQKSSKHFCSVCNKTFVSANFLDRHVRLKHSRWFGEAPNSGAAVVCKTRKQTFVCGFCSEEFSKEESLAEHVESLHKGLSADSAESTCPVCGCSCPNQMLFSVHYDAAHCMNSALFDSTTSVLPEPVDSPVCRCKVCEMWFTSEEFLRGHQCSKQTPVRQPPKTGRARYRCMQCGEAFEILRRFLHHRKVKHRVLGPDKTGPSTTSTPSTDLSANTTADVVNGLDAAASQCTRGRPPKSDDAQADQNDDDEKQNDSPQKQQPVHSSSPEGANVVCPECRRSFSTVAQLRRHRKSEHRNRTCQLCGETCKSADMVYYHNLKYHHEQKCEVCGASCSGRLGLIDHFRSQHPTEPPPLINRKTLICEYCPRVFAGCASRLLRDHIESCHLGRVHLCDVCGKRLGSAQTLAVHRRMHDPVARFECHECNRRFPHNTNLMNHIRKHHPERLPAKYVREFRCDVCSMQFGSSSGLSRHRSEKHGTQRFQCDMCLRVFPSVTGLRVHKRRDHQPKETSSASTPVTPSVVATSEAVLTPPPPPQVVAQFSADPTNAIMAGFMANMIGLPGLAQTFQ